MSMMSYMRTTLLAEDDPRRESSGYFLEPADLDTVLAGIAMRIAEGYSLDIENFPNMLNHGLLFGNFADLSAAFSVPVPPNRLNEVADRLREFVRDSRFNAGQKAAQDAGTRLAHEAIKRERREGYFNVSDR